MKVQPEIIYISNDQKGQIEHFMEEWNNEQDFISSNTSGSTGSPKTIKINKKFMIASALNTLSFLNLAEGNTAYLCMSMDSIAGKMMLVRSIIGNLQLYVGPVSNDTISVCPSNIDFIAMVPSQLEKAIETNIDKLSSFGKIIIGGAPISVDLLEKINDSGLSVYHTYGMTETISHIAMRKVGREAQPYFEALSGVTFATSEDQQLIINAPIIGVHEMKTNDLVELLDSNKFVWLGRSDFVINSGGVKIIPENVEMILSKWIKNPFYITSIPDIRLGERLIIMVESNKPLMISKEQLASALHKYSIPKEQHCVDHFVYTSSGKINRLETNKLERNVIAPIL